MERRRDQIESGNPTGMLRICEVRGGSTSAPSPSGIPEGCEQGRCQRRYLSVVRSTFRPVYSSQYLLATVAPSIAGIWP